MIPSKPKMSSHNCDKNHKNDNNVSKKDESETESDDSSDEDEPIKAPTNLLEEFLVYVIGKKWEDAFKLCQFILIYEPDNKEANEFLPLIRQKLEEKSDGTDDDQDESEEDDEEDETDSGSDDDTDSEESSSEETDDDDDVQTPRTKSIQK